MKKIFWIVTVIVVLIGTAFKIADDIITRLGMQQQQAQWFIIKNFIGRFDNGPMDLGVEGSPGSVYNQSKAFQIPYMRSLPSIIAGDKTGAAKEMCDYVKKYVESEEFLKNYNSLREEAMPLEDKGMNIPRLKRDKVVFEKNISNYKTDTKYVAEQQKLLDETQRRIDALLEAAKKPFPGKQEWEKAYPADPTAAIKKRLEEYLQLAGTVDFNAKLAEPDKYRKRKFINPEHEKKSLKWKAIYRAGKEVNDGVTAFVKDWLKQGVKVGITPTQTTGNSAAANNVPATTTPPATNNAPAANTTTDTTTIGTEVRPEKKKGLKGLKDKAKKILNR